MPITGKKNETLTMKVSAETESELREICRAEDRPMSYVVRELAMRGLSLYRRDGRVRPTAEEEATIRQNAPRVPDDPTVIPSGYANNITLQDESAQVDAMKDAAMIRPHAGKENDLTKYRRTKKAS